MENLDKSTNFKDIIMEEELIRMEIEAYKEKKILELSDSAKEYIKKEYDEKDGLDYV